MAKQNELSDKEFCVYLRKFIESYNNLIGEAKERGITVTIIPTRNKEALFRARQADFDYSVEFSKDAEI